MKALVAVLLFSAALVRCGGDAPPPQDVLGGPVPAEARAQQTACEKRGGRWGRGGAAGFFVCYETTRDGGKSCSAASDCQGLCLSKSRTCAPVTPLYGCNDILDSRGNSQSLCVQ